MVLRCVILAILGVSVRPAKVVCDNVALAVKSGTATAADRLPILRELWLKNFNNYIVIGDGDRHIGDLQMHDVLDLLPDPFKPKRGLVRPRSSSTKVEATSGWKLDAHKNLPGLKLLYETFPLSPFYMLVDDDTYIFVGNLIDKVTAIDPEKAAWFGSSHVFTSKKAECKVIAGTKMPFAHGGAGILLSRAAMAMLLEVYDECLAELHDCPLGDVRVSRCLQLYTSAKFYPSREHQSRYVDQADENMNWLMKDAPITSGSNACTQPISFHKMGIQMEISLRYAEEFLQAKGTPVNMGAIWQLQMTGSSTQITHNDTAASVGYEDSSRRSGLPVNNIMLSKSQDCQGLCDLDHRCQAWNSNELAYKCILLGSVGVKYTAVGWTSGLPRVCRQIS